MGTRGLRLAQVVGWALIALGALVWFFAQPSGFPLTDDPVPFFVGLFLASLSLPLLTTGRVRVFFLVAVTVLVVLVALSAWGFARNPM